MIDSGGRRLGDGPAETPAPFRWVLQREWWPGPLDRLCDTANLDFSAHPVRLARRATSARPPVRRPGRGPHFAATHAPWWWQSLESAPGSVSSQRCVDGRASVHNAHPPTPVCSPYSVPYDTIRVQRLARAICGPMKLPTRLSTRTGDLSTHLRGNALPMDESAITLYLRGDLVRLRGRGGVDYCNKILGCIVEYKKLLPHYDSACEQFLQAVTQRSRDRHVVHSTSYRSKDPWHLVDKLRRKCLDGKVITAKTCFTTDGVTDLGGVRLLHLYKNEWLQVHDLICAVCHPDSGSSPRYEIHDAVIYLRSGEDKEYSGNGWTISDNEKELVKGVNGSDNTIRSGARIRIKENDRAYSSIHYTLRCSSEVWSKDFWGNRQLYIEVQVRTVFEEGWGEIDHQRKYPHGSSDVVGDQLGLLNAAASVADRIVRSFKNIDQLPYFVHQEVELRCVRAARKVKVYSDTLEWAADNRQRVVDQVVYSETTFTYYVPMSADTSTSDRGRTLQEALREAKVENRVHWRQLNQANVAPLFTDLLLLEDTVYDSKGTETTIGMTGAPARSKDTGPRRDILVTESSDVQKVQQFFDWCEKNSSEWTLLV